MVATIRMYEPGVVERRSSVVPTQAAQTSVGLLGEGLQQAGDAAWTFEDEIATAHAYQTDAEWNDFLRVTMHGDGEGTPGYLNSEMGDAVGGREGMIEALNSRYQDLVSSLNPRVRPGAVRSMESRYQTVLNQINQHAETQARRSTAAAASGRAASAAAAMEADIHAHLVASLSGDSEELARLEASFRDAILESGIPEGTPEFDEEFRDYVSRGRQTLIQNIEAEQGPQAARDVYESEGFASGLRPEELMSVVGPMLNRATEADGRELTRRVFQEGVESAIRGAQPSVASPEAMPSVFSEMDRSAPSRTGFVTSDASRPTSVFNPPAAMPMRGPQDWMQTDLPVSNPIAARPAPYRPVSDPIGDIFGYTQAARTTRASTTLFAARGETPRPVPVLPGDRVVQPARLMQIDYNEMRNEIIANTENNPLARAAALEEFDSMIEADMAQRERDHGRALEAARILIDESGGTDEGWNRAMAAYGHHFTQDERNTLWERRNSALTQTYAPFDDEATVFGLTALEEAGQVEAYRQLLEANINNLTRSTATAASQTLARMIAGTDAVGATDATREMIGSEIEQALRDAGMPMPTDAQVASGTGLAALRASRRIQLAMRSWTNSYIEGADGRQPTPDEAREMLTRLMSVEATHGGIFYDSSYTTAIGNLDLDLPGLVGAIRDGTLELNGEVVSEDVAQSTWSDLTRILGREPREDEFTAALFMSYAQREQMLDAQPDQTFTNPFAREAADADAEAPSRGSSATRLRNR